MTVDEQKTNRDMEISRRARLYGKLFALQRSGAPEEEIDGVLVELGVCEAEIRRMSDEVNDRIWYQNYNKILDGYGEAVRLLQQKDGQDSQILSEIGGLRGGQLALQAEFREGLQGVQSTVSALGETVDQHGEQITALSQDMAAVKEIIEARPAQRKQEAEQFAERQAAIEARQALIEERQAAIQARQDELEAERGKYTPEERESLTNTLLRMIREYQEEHPEAAGNGDTG